MEKATEFFKLSEEESASVSRLTIHPHRIGLDCSFYEDFALRGIRVDRVEPGFVSCTFKVPPRLTDRGGKLATGAIANLVDEVGGAVVFVEGLPMNVSVDMCISFLSTANVNAKAFGIGTVEHLHYEADIHDDDVWTLLRLIDELEITSKVLGCRGGYAGTLVLVKNKATGELIAEGRHSLFGKHNSKM